MAATDPDPGRPGVPRAKTSVPRPPARYVDRPRLRTAMEEAAPGQVVLVCAPAGYGKTVLLARWASRHPGTGWVSLDGDDDDGRFWAAVLTALGAAVPEAEAAALERMVIPRAPSRDPAFLAAVVDTVGRVPAEVRLVLDDVHELTGPAPLHGLEVLVRDRPANLRLVLAARTDPPLPLGRMRLHGELLDVRADDLRFSVPEARAVLAAADVAATAEQVRDLVAQTEGWAAGLRLASSSLRDAGDVGSLLPGALGRSRAVVDYLDGEVLARVRADELDLLRALSVCAELPVGLAAAVSRRADAGEVLDALERATPLVLSSDRVPVRYRLHPLLRSHLLGGLERRRPDVVAQLHRRAATWLSGHGERLPALAHAREGGDRLLLADLLRRDAVPLLVEGAHRDLRDALDGLGAEHVGEDPWLSLVAGLLDAEHGALRSADDHLRRAQQAWPAEPSADLVALRDLVHARRVSMAGDPVEMLRSTADPGPRADDLGVLQDVSRALALVATGRPQEALPVAEEALHRSGGRERGYLAALGFVVLAAAEGARGRYGEMVALAARSEAAGCCTDWGSSAGGAYASGLRAYGALLAARPAECLELLAPADAFGRADGVGAVRQPSAVLPALRGAALADLGRGADALEHFRQARALSGTRPQLAQATALVALVEQRAALQLGHQALSRTVLEWAAEVLGDAGDVALLRAYRLTGMGRYGAAADDLAPLLDGSVPTQVPWAQVEAWVLECRVALLRDRRARALAALEQALGLARSMQVLRPLATATPEVAELLTRHLGSFGALEATARSVLAARLALGADRRPVALTDRERAVLRQLPSLRSFDEIAADLTISHSTVKTHVRAIYSKLGVTSRRDAVGRAHRDGLLHPDAR